MPLTKKEYEKLLKLNEDIKNYLIEYYDPDSECIQHSIKISISNRIGLMLTTMY